MTSHSPLAVFRADAGRAIGGGHVVRCLALAGAFAREGWRCALAANAETLETLADPAPVAVESLPPGADAADEVAAMMRRWPEGCDLLIVDHYRRDAGFEAACRPWARRILVIDDLADRPHDYDLLLDATPGRAAADYAGLVPGECTLLPGPDYAPLRPDFATRRRRALPRDVVSPPCRVLVSLGAAPRAETVSAVLDGLGRSGCASHVSVAIGGDAPEREALARRLAAMNGTLHVATENMAALMADADIAIGAAGMSGWERCCLGLPTLLLVLADNQRANARALSAAGAARLCDGPVDAAAIAAALCDMAADVDGRRRMSRRAAQFCDGLGAARVVAAIDPPRARDGAAILLRPARQEDAAITHCWQKHPLTRRHARNPAVPGRAEHEEWLARKLADPRCVFHIVECGGRPAGVLRLDRTENPDAFEVSVLVAPDWHRRGIGAAALDLARRLVPDADLLAYIKPGNAASRALFAAAGYAAEGRDGWFLRQAREKTET